MFEYVNTWRRRMSNEQKWWGGSTPPVWLLDLIRCSAGGVGSGADAQDVLSAALQVLSVGEVKRVADVPALLREMENDPQHSFTPFTAVVLSRISRNYPEARTQFFRRIDSVTPGQIAALTAPQLLWFLNTFVATRCVDSSGINQAVSILLRNHKLRPHRSQTEFRVKHHAVLLSGLPILLPQCNEARFPERKKLFCDLVSRFVEISEKGEAGVGAVGAASPFWGAFSVSGVSGVLSGLARFGGEVHPDRLHSAAQKAVHRFLTMQTHKKYLPTHDDDDQIDATLPHHAATVLWGASSLSVASSTLLRTIADGISSGVIPHELMKPIDIALILHIFIKHRDPKSTKPLARFTILTQKFVHKIEKVGKPRKELTKQEASMRGEELTVQNVCMVLRAMEAVPMPPHQIAKVLTAFTTVFDRIKEGARIEHLAALLTSHLRYFTTINESVTISTLVFIKTATLMVPDLLKKRPYGPHGGIVFRSILALCLRCSIEGARRQMKIDVLIPTFIGSVHTRMLQGNVPLRFYLDLLPSLVALRAFDEPAFQRIWEIKHFLSSFLKGILRFGSHQWVGEEAAVVIHACLLDGQEESRKLCERLCAGMIGCKQVGTAEGVRRNAFRVFSALSDLPRMDNAVISNVTTKLLYELHASTIVETPTSPSLRKMMPTATRFSRSFALWNAFLKAYIVDSRKTRLKKIFFSKKRAKNGEVCIFLEDFARDAVTVVDGTLFLPLLRELRGVVDYTQEFLYHLVFDVAIVVEELSTLLLLQRDQPFVVSILHNVTHILYLLITGFTTTTPHFQKRAAIRNTLWRFLLSTIKCYDNTGQRSNYLLISCIAHFFESKETMTPDFCGKEELLEELRFVYVHLKNNMGVKGVPEVLKRMNAFMKEKGCVETITALRVTNAVAEMVEVMAVLEGCGDVIRISCLGGGRYSAVFSSVFSYVASESARAALLLVYPKLSAVSVLRMEVDVKAEHRNAQNQTLCARWATMLQAEKRQKKGSENEETERPLSENAFRTMSIVDTLKILSV